MIALLAALSIFRDARPDQAGFQPSWLYVVLCLVVPVVIGVLMTAITMGVERLVVRRKG